MKTSATSRSFQTQRNWKIANDASAGHRHRQHQPVEGLEVAGAVDLGRLDHGLGQRGHVVAHDVDRQRHAEPDVREPDRREGAVDARARRRSSASARSPRSSGRRASPRWSGTAQSRPGNSMKVKAYAANAAIRIGMKVAGSAIAKLLMNAVAEVRPGRSRPCSCCEGQVGPGCVKTVHQPVLLASSRVRNEVMKVPTSGSSTAEADQRPATSLASPPGLGRVGVEAGGLATTVALGSPRSPATWRRCRRAAHRVGLLGPEVPHLVDHDRDDRDHQHDDDRRGRHRC